MHIKRHRKTRVCARRLCCSIECKNVVHAVWCIGCTLAFDPLFLARRVDELRPNTFSMAAAVTSSVWGTRDGRRTVGGYRLTSAATAAVDPAVAGLAVQRLLQPVMLLVVSVVEVVAAAKLCSSLADNGAGTPPMKVLMTMKLTESR